MPTFTVPPPSVAYTSPFATELSTLPATEQTIPTLSAPAAQTTTKPPAPPTTARVITTKPSTKPTTTKPPVPATTTAPPVIAGYRIVWAQKEILRLSNIERDKAGLLPLTMGSDSLQSAANTRAREASVRWGHTRPNGLGFVSVFTQYFVLYQGAGENLSKVHEQPEQIVAAWMASPTHKANILNPKYEEVCMGFYRAENGAAYWAQLFLQPI
jgi:uncharacterized protein YkwD